MQLKYYNSAVHQAAFVLPEFARKVGAAWHRVVWCLGHRDQGFPPTRPALTLLTRPPVPTRP